MTKQERYELLVKCCEEFGGILDNVFESGMMSEEDMSDAESTENALWAIALSLKEEIENEVTNMVFDMRDKLCSDFIEMTTEIQIIYGVPSVLDNEHEIVGYLCPYCGEPIYFEDWVEDYLGGQDMGVCPICKEDLEVN